MDIDHENLADGQKMIMAKIEEVRGMHEDLRELQQQTIEVCKMMAQTTIWLIRIHNPDAPIPPDLQRVLDRTA